MSTTAMYDVMGPKARQRVRNLTVLGVVVVGLLVAGAIWQLGRNGLLTKEVWSILGNRDFARLMFDGALATLKIALVGIVLSFSGGLGLMILSMSGSKIVRAITRVWVELFRGIPLLVLIFFMYLGLPAVGIVLDTFWSMTLAIALFNSAVMCEILRSGANALPVGQSEAAYALGFRKYRVVLKIVLPQAIKIMLPALVSQMVVVLKESSLGFVIGYGELLRNGRITVDYTGTIHAIPVYIVIGLMYLSINLLLSTIAREIQRRNSKSIDV